MSYYKWYLPFINLPRMKKQINSIWRVWLSMVKGRRCLFGKPCQFSHGKLVTAASCWDSWGRLGETGSHRREQKLFIWPCAYQTVHVHGWITLRVSGQMPQGHRPLLCVCKHFPKSCNVSASVYCTVPCSTCLPPRVLLQFNLPV